MVFLVTSTSFHMTDNHKTVQSTKQTMGKSPILIRDEDIWSFLIRKIGLSIFSLNFIGGLLIAYVATRDISYVTPWCYLQLPRYHHYLHLPKLRRQVVPKL